MKGIIYSKTNVVYSLIKVSLVSQAVHWQELRGILPDGTKEGWEWCPLEGKPGSFGDMRSQDWGLWGSGNRIAGRFLSMKSKKNSIRLLMHFTTVQKNPFERRPSKDDHTWLKHPFTHKSPSRLHSWNSGRCVAHNLVSKDGAILCVTLRGSVRSKGTTSTGPGKGPGPLTAASGSSEAILLKWKLISLLQTSLRSSALPVMAE